MGVGKFETTECFRIGSGEIQERWLDSHENEWIAAAGRGGVVERIHLVITLDADKAIDKTQTPLHVKSRRDLSDQVRIPKPANRQ